MTFALKTTLKTAGIALILSTGLASINLASAQNEPEKVDPVILQDEVITSETSSEQAPVATEDIELLAPRKIGRGQDMRGVRIAKPGALLFASFDDDHSLTISIAEIEANAAAAFERADTNKSGSLSIFEQQDWAEAVGSHDGPLANAVTFDTNIDRQVTSDEFTLGLKRLAKSYMGKDATEIEFESLLFNPNGKSTSTKRKTKLNESRENQSRRSAQSR